MRPDELEERLQKRLDALGLLPEPSCSTSSRSPISRGQTGSAPITGTTQHVPFAELLIDCEEARTLRAVLVGMLRENDRR